MYLRPNSYVNHGAMPQCSGVQSLCTAVNPDTIEERE